MRIRCFIMDKSHWRKFPEHCVLKCEVIWDLMGEKFIFTQWYLLLKLSGRSCTFQPETQIPSVNLGK